jgi:methylglyoxal synthase
VTQFESGPLGGDEQIGSRISEGQIDCVILFSDPLEPQCRDPNRASADFIISSPLVSTVYERLVPDYSEYRARWAIGARRVQSKTLNNQSGYSKAVLK